MRERRSFEKLLEDLRTLAICVALLELVLKGITHLKDLEGHLHVNSRSIRRYVDGIVERRVVPLMGVVVIVNNQVVIKDRERVKKFIQEFHKGFPYVKAFVDSFFKDPGKEVEQPISRGSARCPECGSTNIVSDFVRGETACKGCALVLDGRMFEEKDVSVTGSSNMGNYHGRSSREKRGKEISRLSHIYDKGTCKKAKAFKRKLKPYLNVIEQLIPSKYKLIKQEILRISERIGYNIQGSKYGMLSIVVVAVKTYCGKPPLSFIDEIFKIQCMKEQKERCENLKNLSNWEDLVRRAERRIKLWTLNKGRWNLTA